MSSTEPLDAVVVGSGQAGTPLAEALAKAGRRTALVERAQVGGSCINFGCTPTKTMVASARVAHLARRAADYGVDTGPVSVDLGRVRERKRSIVESFRGGVLEGIEETDGLELVRGHARLAGSGRVEVDLAEGGRRTLAAERIFLDPGTRTRRPPIDGLDDVAWLDEASIQELGETPEHLLVVGGGYVGLELAQMFRRFGSRVTVVQLLDQLLPREDEDVARAVLEILREDGIDVLVSTEPERVSAGDGGRIRLQVSGPDGERELAGSHLLLAAGRRPNTDDLGLDAAGVATDDKGFIRVNDRLETSADGIWAMGDAKGGPAFTHVSFDDFRVLRTNLLEGGDATIAGRLVPYTVFIDPQLGRVGLTEREARERGLDVKVAKLEMAHVARAREVDETRGFMKALVDGESGRILGCAILGIEGGEVMAVIETAMVGGLPFTALRDGIYAHPTLAESLNNLFDELED